MQRGHNEGGNLGSAEIGRDSRDGWSTLRGILEAFTRVVSSDSTHVQPLVEEREYTLMLHQECEVVT